MCAEMCVIVWITLAQLIWINMTQCWTPVCPQKCNCQIRPVQIYLLKAAKVYKTVDCSSRALLRIPRDLPADAEAVILTNNSITMHVGINQMPELQLLDLSHNAIQGFYGRLVLLQLEHLDLSHNTLTRITSSDNDFFAPLRNLQTLNVRGNRIETIHGETLDLPRLTSLDVAENLLTTLDDGIFVNLHQLSSLDLSQNHISDESFAEDSLEAYHLKQVNLSYSQITHFVTRNIYITSLDLTGNHFYQLNRHTFEGIQAEVLNLSSMPFLWTISSNAFDEFKDLTFLDLSNSTNLTYIAPGAFSKLKNLTSINLDNTNITQLPFDTSSEPVNTTQISLRNVSLSCFLNAQFLLSNHDRNLSCRWRNNTVKSADLPALMKSPEWRDALPVILPTFPERISADLGSVLELQCLTAGSVSKVTWMRGDPRRNRTYTLPSFSGLLRLGPLFRVDSGSYLCRAENEFGIVARHVVVNVTYAPVIIIPLAVTPQYVTFAWNNSDPSIASQFRVTYYENIEGNFSLIRTIYMGHLVRTYTISNLKPATLYKICLLLNKSGNVDQLDCKTFTTKTLDPPSRKFQAAYEVLIAIGCISSLLFMIFMSTCVYRFYQDKQQESMAESLSRILLSDSSCMTSEATTPTTYFNPGVDPLTPTTDLDIRSAFLPETHPYRHIPHQLQATHNAHSQMESTMF